MNCVTVMCVAFASILIGLVTEKATVVKKNLKAVGDFSSTANVKRLKPVQFSPGNFMDWGDAVVTVCTGLRKFKSPFHTNRTMIAMRLDNILYKTDIDTNALKGDATLCLIISEGQSCKANGSTVVNTSLKAKTERKDTAQKKHSTASDGEINISKESTDCYNYKDAEEIERIQYIFVMDAILSYVLFLNFLLMVVVSHLYFR